MVVVVAGLRCFTNVLRTMEVAASFVRPLQRGRDMNFGCRAGCLRRVVLASASAIVGTLRPLSDRLAWQTSLCIGVEQCMSGPVRML